MLLKSEIIAIKIRQVIRFGNDTNFSTTPITSQMHSSFFGTHCIIKEKIEFFNLYPIIKVAMGNWRGEVLAMRKITAYFMEVGI